MTDILIAPPTVEPLTAAQAKLHLKSSQSAEDALVTAWIAAARGQAERFLTKAIVLQTRRLVLDCLPSQIDIEWAPLRAVQSIQYLDEAGVLQTLAADQYRVDKFSSPARITPGYDVTWPSTYGVPNAVLVTYTAGMLVPVVADAAADTLTADGHGFADADITQIATIGGVLPTGLSASTNYHVRDSAANTLKLAATAGGAAIDITAAGTVPNVLGRIPKEIEAAMLLMIGDLDQHRGETVTGTLVQEISRGVESLLLPFKFQRF